MLDLLTWTPAGLFFGIVGIVTVPFLGVLVVLSAALAVLVALVAAIVMGSYWLAHSLARRSRKPAEAVHPAAVRVSAEASRAGRVP
jgi:5-bromo-4-chloroindolyl phosphate hydrolysis protein